VPDRIDFGSEPWKAVPRRILRDPRLSPAAKGGLVCLLSHEEGWVRSCIATLMKDNRVGRAGARNIMRELCDLGYAQLDQPRGAGGKFKTAYVVYTEAKVRGGKRNSDRGRPTGGGAPGAVHSPAVVEPQEGTTQEENLSELSLATGKKMGKPNPIFDALAELHGGTENLSRPMAKTVGVATAAIRRATPNVNAGEIHRRARNYTWLSWNDTRRPPSAQALAKWWADCDTDPPVDARYDPAPPLTEEDWQRAIEASDKATRRHG
jgi:hypothetical protein